MDDAVQDPEPGSLPAATPLAAGTDVARFGGRAARLARMLGAGLPVPPGVVVDIAVRDAVDLAETGPIVALRASVGDRRWGGPASILNVGICEATLPGLVARIGRRAALEAYRRAIRTWGVRVEGLETEAFENLAYDQSKFGRGMDAEALGHVVEASLALVAAEAGRPYPDDPAALVAGARAAMTREWSSPTARILRQANGAPEDATMAVVVQRMVFGLGAGGAGRYQPVDATTGQPRETGRFLPDAQGRDAGRGGRTPHMITEAERAEAGQTRPSLEMLDPGAHAALADASAALTRGTGEVHEIEFAIEAGRLWLLDAIPVRGSARASVRIAVDLAQAGTITRSDALLRIDPTSLGESLHPQVDPAARRDILGSGLPASPGAATGVVCFSPEAAMAAAAQDLTPILVRVETSPEDVRGMHAAAAVLTVRGGMTSHAAVIARGLGLPAVVGANDLRLDARAGVLIAGARRIAAGERITIDGTRGEVLAGAPQMVPAVPSDAFDTLMGWADEVRHLGVRANADTPAEAALARRFGVDGLGLCRTEHMFFEAERIHVMREMILAETDAARNAALDRLLPMQRVDFQGLFETMRGLPVTIRLLDPPLHEFLPQGDAEFEALARAMGADADTLRARAADMAEFNPMLGKRGVRVGITSPEIYDMQARAIFEAAIAAAETTGMPVIPEIMIPLVSARREVELVRARVDAVARAVMEERGARIEHRIGVMVETPRGALRAHDLATVSAFLSFGTNDLTQMTYGLSRDDAGRFMRDYVAKGVFSEDPFHSLDIEGVGELLLIAARRGREANPDLTLGLCGEHGGDPETIRFCKVAGFDYVSCSPFRVPIARLAAAQASILADRPD